MKIIGRCSEFDGKRWEDFIQVNLPHLDQFQFVFFFHKMKEQTREDFQKIIQSFRSPFWVEHKKWFVQCQWHPFNSSNYELYSIPRCISSLEMDFDWKKEIISTGDQTFQTTNIEQITLRLRTFLTESILTSMNILYFPNVTKLHLDFHGNLLTNLTNLLSKMLNLSRLIEVQLKCNYRIPESDNFLCDLLTLFEQSPKLSRLAIQSMLPTNIWPNMKRIFERIPPQIRYLKIPIRSIEEMKMILERCNQLIVLQSSRKSLAFSTETLEWIEENTLGSIDLRSD